MGNNDGLSYLANDGGVQVNNVCPTGILFLNNNQHLE